MNYTRRGFIKTSLLSGCSLYGSFETNGRAHAYSSDGARLVRPLFAPGEYRRIDAKERVYHISCSPDMFDQYEDLAEIWSAAGVTDAWLCTWFYGYFPYSWEKIDHCLDLIVGVDLINSCFFYIEDLTSKRKDSLCCTASGSLC